MGQRTFGSNLGAEGTWEVWCQGIQEDGTPCTKKSYQKGSYLCYVHRYTKEERLALEQAKAAKLEAEDHRREGER